MKRPRAIIFVLFLSIAFSLFAPAVRGAEQPANVNFSGTLIDPLTGFPVVGIRLSLVEPGEYFATTDPTGRFTFASIPPGTYEYMFAYQRTDKGPEGSILVARKINVEAAAPANTKVKISYHLLKAYPPTEEEMKERQKREGKGEARPGEDKLKVIDLNFIDRKRREDTRPIILREMFGIDWPEEYFSAPIAFEPGKCRLSSVRVVDGISGAEVPCQLSNIVFGRADFVNFCVITFPATLQKFQNKVYATASDGGEGYALPKYDTDLALETDKATGEQILSNSLVAFRIPPNGAHQLRDGENGPPPVAALRGPDGLWFGKGQLVSSRKPQSYTCEQTETGALFKEFKITYKFAEEKGETEQQTLPQAEYELTLRLYSHRDYLLVRERMTGQIDLSFRFSFYANLAPDTLLCARNGSPVFESLADPLQQDERTLAVLRAWNPPGLRNSHNWCGVYSSAERKDAIGVVQVNGGRWDFPGRNDWGDGTWLRTADNSKEMRLVAVNAPDLYLELPHRPGTREFALVVFDKNRNWTRETLAAEKPPENKSHYLNRLHIALSQMNLVRWTAAKPERALLDEQPRLLFNTLTYPLFKEIFDRFPNRFPEEFRDVFSGSRIHTTAIRTQIFARAAALRRALLGAADEKQISGFSSILANSALIAPQVKELALLYDANVRSGLFSERENNSILATLALVAAQLEGADYWGLSSYSPRLAACRGTALTWISLLLNRCPQSLARITGAESIMTAELAGMLATGGLPTDSGEITDAINLWTEAAHTLDLAAPPTLSRASPFTWPTYIETLAQIPGLTLPPDKRYGGARLLPPIGESLAGDTASLAFLGAAAQNLAPASPELAQRLAWAWEQAGQPPVESRPAYSRLLPFFAPEPIQVSPAPPQKLESTPLPGFGALLRTQFGQPDEAYLIFKCGPQPLFHHDQASLIFHPFATPLLIDPASPPGRQGAWAHNTVRIDSRVHNAPGTILLYTSGEDDDYVIGQVTVDSLSKLREYTQTELDAAMAEQKSEPRTPPPGHRPDASQTPEMVPAQDKLEHPVVITRQILFNKPRQYVIILDRIAGRLPTDVFFDVFADQARLKDNVASFLGPFGVDAEIHTFGSGPVQATLNRDLPQRWCLRLTQPAPPQPKPPQPEPAEPKPAEPKPTKPNTIDKKSEPAPPDTPAEEPETPVVEYLTVICPIRRGEPGDRLNHFAAPTVERLEKLPALRLAYGGIVRYIFLSDKEIEYNRNGVHFKGTRGILTIRPTHFDIALLDAGEMFYENRGLHLTAGTASLRFAPGGFVSGLVDGAEKQLLFRGLGLAPRHLSFRTDGQEFNSDGDTQQIGYGIHPGRHTLTIYPR